ncbi:MAG: hypothetical protein ACJAT1_001826 [Marivirga sp.]|jgi:hypothetical protein
MKKKVLPLFHHHYIATEEALIVACKNHFTALKLEGLVIIPFTFVVDARGIIEALSLSALSQNPDLPFIEQLWQSGEKRCQAKEASCFAVCYDAHVFDAEEVDQDALVLLLKKADGSQQQLNFPYVVAEEGLVFGDTWLEDFTNSR